MDHQAIRFRGGPADRMGELFVVKGGKRRTYVWIGGERGECVAHFAGPKALRALAKAILKEVGDE